MTTIFRSEHPEYARIAAHIERARAERALLVGEAIGNGIVALVSAVHGWRTLFAPRGTRKHA